MYRYSCLVLIRVIKYIILSCFFISLTSCSGLYTYQPPAPIYGGSNPYATVPSDKVETVTAPDAAKIASSVPEKKINDILKFEPPVAPKPLSPAILALISEADRNSKAGKLESSVAIIERALRIDPRNPILTYKLAKLRLNQFKPRLAEDLAKKAALLSVNDKKTKKQSWLLISEARRQQKKYHGAKEAKLKAEKIF